jgi:hypothetical protein
VSRTGALQNFFGNIFCRRFRLVLVAFWCAVKSMQLFVSDCETNVSNVDVEMSLFFSMFFCVFENSSGARLLV